MKAGVIKCIQTSARTKALDVEDFFTLQRYSVFENRDFAVAVLFVLGDGSSAYDVDNLLQECVAYRIAWLVQKAGCIKVNPAVLVLCQRVICSDFDSWNWSSQRCSSSC